MASKNPSGRDVLRGALGPGKDCPPIETLEGALDAEHVPQQVALHLEACSYCRAELDLLRAFLQEPSHEETEPVRAVADRLHLPRPADAVPSVPFWKMVFQTRWLSPAMIAAAGVLIIVAVGIQWQHAVAPRISAPNQPEGDVLRSGRIQVLEPVGDVSTLPSSIRWQPVAGAERYEVELLEVDHTEMWKISTASPQLAIPVPVQAKIVPAKTILLEVEAIGKSGRKLAQSDAVSFRLLQKVYKR